ncbi:MAG: hypothetical protein FWJ72_04170, partial [Acidimicrobiia bacterium]
MADPAAAPALGVAEPPEVGVRAVELAAALRREGVPVPTGATVAYARALAAAGTTPSGVYWSGRA